MQKEPAADWIKLDFEQARAKHLLFKSRLRSILYGVVIDEAPVVSHQECTLGKWIYGHALDTYAHIPEVNQLEQVHADLHTVARELVVRYHEGKVWEARNGLDDIERMAAGLVELLSIIEAQVQQRDTTTLINTITPETLDISREEYYELQRLNNDLDRHIREQSQELLEARERFELVAKATQDAVWDWNFTTHALWWNEGFSELFGYQKEEIEPTIDSWDSRIHPDDKNEVIKSIYQVIDHGGKQWTAEYRFRKADGSYAIVCDRAYALYNSNGEPYRVVGSMQDISQRKLSEEAIRQSESKLRNIILQAPVAMCIFRGENHIVEIANDALLEIWGKTKEQVIGKPTFEANPEGRGQGFEEILETIYRTGESFRVDEIPLTLLRHGKRERFYTNLSYDPIKESDGTVTGILVVGIEVTEQVVARRKIEEVVAERTIELAHANEELRRSNINLEEFAYAASHDLKEPIRKIHVFSDRLKASLEDKLTGDDKMYFNRMGLATQRMSALIDDLLLYSHVSRGAELDEMVDLNQKVRNVMGDLELELEEKKATVTVEALPTIKGHRRQLQQLFQNLIGNAIKYSKPGVLPEVHISSQKVHSHDKAHHLTKQTDNGTYHLIEVKDNGIGFDPEEAERIFNVFTRLHGNVEYKGTGVGLSIARKVVENHGGYIWADGKPGEGATFKILLPTE